MSRPDPDGSGPSRRHGPIRRTALTASDAAALATERTERVVFGVHAGLRRPASDGPELPVRAALTLLAHTTRFVAVLAAVLVGLVAHRFIERALMHATRRFVMPVAGPRRGSMTPVRRVSSTGQACRFAKPSRLRLRAFPRSRWLRRERHDVPQAAVARPRRQRARLRSDLDGPADGTLQDRRLRTHQAGRILAYPRQSPGFRPYGRRAAPRPALARNARLGGPRGRPCRPRGHPRRARFGSLCRGRRVVSREAARLLAAGRRALPDVTRERCSSSR